ncbi:MAG: DUF3604 domain-containing protein [Anaerolineales bacterium]|nr:DUF3604 domain-containing protein [Anaerolineales bacterium]
MHSISNQDEYRNLRVYYGDLHNHCAVSYGKGSLENALSNARLQLDFVSVTVHAVWPDLPADDPRLDYLVDYHRKGFAKAFENWKDYLGVIETYNLDGEFVTFPSFEWHSNQYGDYCVYYKQGADLPILQSANLPTLKDEAESLGAPVFIIPHHIGYKSGWRGINWAEFSERLSPVVEIFSFHGLSESTEGPYPYLHSMGPRHEMSTAQYGWAQGKRFGVIASTDHHNAFPGSYGYGRLAVWAEARTRAAIWEAIARRRTYALTGDNIELGFSLNGCLMGESCPASSERRMAIHVRGSSAIDYVDVLHNNRVIYRECVLPSETYRQPARVYLEFGWGEEPAPTPWDVDLEVDNGRLVRVEPHFRGYGPKDIPSDQQFAYTRWRQDRPGHVSLQTLTRQNPSVHTAATEGLVLEIDGDKDTLIRANINGQQFIQPVHDLRDGSRSYYLGGFVSPAICFHRAVPENEYALSFDFLHRQASSQSDWYYVRVRQKNDQWAWSSPIWVEP